MGNLDWIFWTAGALFVLSRISSPSLEHRKQAIDNTLEGMRSSSTPNPHDAALYVITKTFLQKPIPNTQEIISYLDSTQLDDGSWKSTMFTTGRVLGAYFLLGATPKKSVEPFLSNYATWADVLRYSQERNSDWRDTYHIIQTWMLWHRSYPDWLDEYWNVVEANLSWTTDLSGYNGGHRRTHILYSYVLARHRWPKLLDIVDTTLAMQRSDGSFPGLSELPSYYPSASWTYDTSIELSLLQEAVVLYGDQLGTERLNKISTAVRRTAPYIHGQYREIFYQGVLYGLFMPPDQTIDIEKGVMTGVMAAIHNGLLSGECDMTFQSLIDQTQSPNALLLFRKPGLAA